MEVSSAAPLPVMSCARVLLRCCLKPPPPGLLQAGASTLAHVGGLSCMEVSSGELVATAGYSKRMGQLMPDNVVKVGHAA